MLNFKFGNPQADGLDFVLRTRFRGGSMFTDKESAPDELTINSLRKAISQYARPDLRTAILQLINTFIPYTALWFILIYMVKEHHPLSVIFTVIIIASLFLVRIFIFFHDCTHGSFFSSSRANKVLGYITGILTFTPFTHWQHNHLVHHGTYADLDRRGVGDIWTQTVEEYRAAPGTMRELYSPWMTIFSSGEEGLKKTPAKKK